MSENDDKKSSLKVVNLVSKDGLEERQKEVLKVLNDSINQAKNLPVINVAVLFAFKDGAVSFDLANSFASHEMNAATDILKIEGG